MSEIPPNALIVVADGAGATLFRNVGKGSDLELQEEQKLTPKNLSDDGPSGSQPDEQSPKQNDEATFAKQLAHAIYKMHHAGKFSEMVLIADPTTLGQFRKAMHKTVESSIVKTLSKDLTNHPIEDITKALA